MSSRLPEKGLWRVSDRHRTDEAAPFDLIKLDLRDRGVGTVRARNLETRLQRIRVTGPDRFAARYDIRGHQGAVEGRSRPDGSLAIMLSGTVTGTFIARPIELVAGEQVVAEPVAGEMAATTMQAIACAVDRLCSCGARALAV
jgi:hypothetical protein